MHHTCKPLADFDKMRADIAGDFYDCAHGPPGPYARCTRQRMTTCDGFGMRPDGPVTPSHYIQSYHSRVRKDTWTEYTAPYPHASLSRTPPRRTRKTAASAEVSPGQHMHFSSVQRGDVHGCLQAKDTEGGRISTRRDYAGGRQTCRRALPEVRPRSARPPSPRRDEEQGHSQGGQPARGGCRAPRRGAPAR